jgi:prepilin-type N-terminal cleavage/methylation domain-containing protein
MKTLRLFAPVQLAYVMTSHSSHQPSSFRASHEDAQPQSQASHAASRKGFTLVELLVVIIIIGMLASLITAAVISALGRATVASIVTDVKQLETACETYKSQYGEYPPDFAGINITYTPDTTIQNTVRTGAQNAVLRHLTKVFPRYKPGYSVSPTSPSCDWPGFLADVQNGWNIDLSSNTYFLSPVGALSFWLGGKPDWCVDTTGAQILPASSSFDPKKPIKGFLGFSANPLNPFDTSSSRIKPFYEFNLNCLFYYTGNSATTPPALGGIAVWPAKAYDANNINKSPIVYFRSSNGSYFYEGTSTLIKAFPDTFYPITSTVAVHPAIDINLSQPSAGQLTWVNSQSVQIFSSGRNMAYGILAPTALGGGLYGNVLQFPTGSNYQNNSPPILSSPYVTAPVNLIYTFDDITNFSGGGTLQDAMP